jgi:hypothetical protein
LLDTDFPENPGAIRQPGFLMSPSRSSPHCGRWGGSFPQKLVACKAMASCYGVLPKIQRLRALPALERGVAIPEGASESLQSKLSHGRPGGCGGRPSTPGRLAAESRPVTGEMVLRRKKKRGVESQLRA